MTPMKKLHFVARLKIHDGQLENFKKIAKACIACVVEKDQGTLQYSWFLNENESECTVLETYKDSESVLNHVGNLGDLLNQLLGASDLTLEVYGHPSEDLRGALAGFDTTIHSHLGSM